MNIIDEWKLKFYRDHWISTFSKGLWISPFGMARRIRSPSFNNYRRELVTAYGCKDTVMDWVLPPITTT